MKQGKVGKQSSCPSSKFKMQLGADVCQGFAIFAGFVLAGKNCLWCGPLIVRSF